jgi:hypothetical protein
MLEHLPFLSYQQPPISKEQFNRWKSDPCTLALKKSLVRSILMEISNPLPNNFDQTVIGAHQREGALSMFDELMAWTPELVDADEN